MTNEIERLDQTERLLRDADRRIDRSMFKFSERKNSKAKLSLEKKIGEGVSLDQTANPIFYSKFSRSLSKPELSNLIIGLRNGDYKISQEIDKSKQPYYFLYLVSR